MFSAQHFPAVAQLLRVGAVIVIVLSVRQVADRVHFRNRLGSGRVALQFGPYGSPMKR